jgi:hypothetical protein
MDIENQAYYKLIRKQNAYSQLLSNGDTVNNSLPEDAIYFINSEQRTVNPEERAKLLFELYPNIKNSSCFYPTVT